MAQDRKKVTAEKRKKLGALRTSLGELNITYRQLSTLFGVPKTKIARILLGQQEDLLLLTRIIAHRDEQQAKLDEVLAKI